ncbi:hypothetical protein A2V61_00720 [Candidatus Woesebacteria bacterium RBG_19FT_COMBO_47_8]|uniref:Deoxynucleoside kinase domain-containing protein n=1 Tax=Candidatus Woesebacteria bacterium RBG_13_46_13 TaxID=1802479 RepID=A0A1F7X4D3_9BACT|nr:MAG: hypothetical protein A2Y68_00860 [Candidatus Woesebacteria bacterium RBG_13_46_13]OGM18036.1 MAG: hypothetical protein A2V61_00720 [Candidatus Woesebacteria bacterium RBG_19FT_COMBO_47_8]HJX59463.1 deoxynucleoside kinase [Patescibacteria group bacterium]
MNSERLLGKDGLDSPEQPKRNLWIVVMGVPASGKSTLAEVVSDRLGFTHVPELKVEDEALFTRYYEDPQRYSFAMQSIFLFNKWQQTHGSAAVGVPGIKELLAQGPVISQPPIWQDALYARARMGRNSEYRYYEEFYKGLVSVDTFPVPDLVIYMRISLANTLLRIQKRAEKEPGRAVELNEKSSYWKKLWKFHEIWVARNLGKMKIAVINGDRFNFWAFENDEVAKEALLQEFLHLARYHLVGPLGGPSNPAKDLLIPEAILKHRPPVRSYDITPGLSTDQKALQRR